MWICLWRAHSSPSTLVTRLALCTQNWERSATWERSCVGEHRWAWEAHAHERFWWWSSWEAKHCLTSTHSKSILNKYHFWRKLSISKKVPHSLHKWRRQHRHNETSSYPMTIPYSEAHQCWTLTAFVRQRASHIPRSRASYITWILHKTRAIVFPQKHILKHKKGTALSPTHLREEVQTGRSKNSHWRPAIDCQTPWWRSPISLQNPRKECESHCADGEAGLKRITPTRSQWQS